MVNFKVLKEQPDELLVLLDNILKEFEVQDDVLIFVMKTNLQGSQNLSKEFLIELEDLTNNYSSEQHPNIDRDFSYQRPGFKMSCLFKINYHFLNDQIKSS